MPRPGEAKSGGFFAGEGGSSPAAEGILRSASSASEKQPEQFLRREHEALVGQIDATAAVME